MNKDIGAPSGPGCEPPASAAQEGVFAKSHPSRVVLDACCGSRMFWFDKHDARALFIDKRRETHVVDIGTPGTVGRSPIVIDPDMLADFTAMPFPNETFNLVIFDPPHIERKEAKGVLTRKYGNLAGDWRAMLREGFAECFRVLKPSGTLVFKWAESNHPLSEILKLTPEKPLIGHRGGKATHWCIFIKDALPSRESVGA